MCVHVCWASLLLSVDRQPKCKPGLCSGVQGSVSRSPEAGKLQSSQAENCSGVWNSGFHLSRGPSAHEVTATVKKTKQSKNLHGTAAAAGFLCKLGLEGALFFQKKVKC